MNYGLVVLTLVLISSSRVTGVQQTAAGAATPQTFEVASIRQNTSGSRNSVVADYKGETFRVTNASLTDVIGWAYGMDYFYVAKFARPSRDIHGRPLIGPLNAMLQSLLAERFRLVVHWETRERSGYALVLAARDGRLGPNVRPSEVDCDAYRAAFMAARAKGTSAPVPVPGWRGTICGMQRRTIGGTTQLLMSA